MNKKNIGVLITASSLIAGALGGGIAAVVQAEDRTNAYAPTLIQRQRISLLDTFLNDDHKEENMEWELKHPNAKIIKDDGNPLAQFAREKISRIAHKILSDSPELFADLGYTKKVDEKTLDDELINSMSMLRLDKNQDTILVRFNKEPVDGQAKPVAYKKWFLKLDLSINYDTDGLLEWANALKPENVLKADGKTRIYPFDLKQLGNLASGFLKRDSNYNDYLKLLDPIKQNKGAADPKIEVLENNPRKAFAKSIIESLILWKIYKLDGAVRIYEPDGTVSYKMPTNMSELRNFIERQESLDNKFIDDINKGFIPFENAAAYFPTMIDLDDNVEIINSDMDVLKTINIGKIEGAKDDFTDFEISALLGLELLPDAAIQINGAQESIFMPDRGNNRLYNAMSTPRAAGEHEFQGKSAFESALDNYKYFIEEDI